MEGDLRDAAVAAAVAGLCVFPLKPRSKEPRLKGGFKSASCDPRYVAGLWSRWADSNIGIDLPARTIVVDVDTEEGQQRVRELELPPAAAVVRTLRGHQGYYRLPEGRELRQGVLDGVGDLKVAGAGYTVLPPSVHPAGPVYAFARGDVAGIVEATLLSGEHVDALERLRGASANGRAPRVNETIRAGGRREALLSLAGTMRRRGLDSDEFLPTLLAVNAARCDPPLGEDEVRELALDMGSRYEPDPQASISGEPAASRHGVDPPTRPDKTAEREFDDERLALVIATFRRYLHLPDPTPLLVVLAAVIANRMTEGDPVWVVVVAGSSRGKTELLIALDGLEGVRIVGKLTVPALLSGTPRKKQAANASGGVLKEIGKRGILVFKDLGVILSMQRDSRAEFLQALRDVFDGRLTRDVGSDGGIRLEWEGHAGMIGAATSALDRAHSVLAQLGERWVTVRLPEGGEDEMVRHALRTTDTASMRRELRRVVSEFLETTSVNAIRELSADEENLFVALASLVCLARSPVERDPYNREILLVHEPEGPARIARQLHKLFVALEAMSLGADQSQRTIIRVGLDSIPSPRREALLHLLDHGETSTAQLATTLNLPTRSTERALEELTAHTLAHRRKSSESDNSRNLWRATKAAHDRWQAINANRSKRLHNAESGSPEMSDPPLPNSPLSVRGDKTGELESP
jgi:hypothetical protein